MSARWSMAATCPMACSGDMYRGVPRIDPTMVPEPLVVTAGPGLCGTSTFEMPKSTILTKFGRSSLFRTKILSGLRSRWTMPFLCAAESPLSTWTMRCVASGMGRTGVFFSVSASDSPSSSSITINKRPSCVRPRSKTSMICGWPMALAARASRSKRSPSWTLALSSSSKVLTATRLPSALCKAS